MEPIAVKEIVNAVEGELLCGNAETLIETVTTDSRKSGKNMLFIPLVGDTFDGHEFIGAAFNMGAVCALTHKDCEAVCSGAIIRVKDTKKALADLARFYLQKFSVPVIALTGSVGKTTTKDMVAAALGEKYRVLKTQGNFNNDIGLPLTIFNLDKEHEIVVLEMGMNHFGEIHHLVSIARPQKAIITNVGMSHIENLGSREGILKSKLEITDYFGKDNILFSNADDDMLGTIQSDRYKIIRYGIDNKNADYIADNIISKPEYVEFDVRYGRDSAHIKVNLPGIHNVYNALAAFAIAKSFDVSDEMIIDGIGSFLPSNMRMDIKKFGNCTLVNDCYNASPTSTVAALSVLSTIEAKRRIAILGDMLEMGDFAKEAHKEIGKTVFDMGIDVLLTVGKESENTNEGAISSGMNKEFVHHFESNAALVGVLGEIINESDAVLVKASRGMHFEQIVAGIENMFSK